MSFHVSFHVLRSKGSKLKPRGRNRFSKKRGGPKRASGRNMSVLTGGAPSEESFKLCCSASGRLLFQAHPFGQGSQRPTAHFVLGGTQKISRRKISGHLDRGKLRFYDFLHPATFRQGLAPWGELVNRKDCTLIRIGNIPQRLTTGSKSAPRVTFGGKVGTRHAPLVLPKSQLKPSRE